MNKFCAIFLVAFMANAAYAIPNEYTGSEGNGLYRTLIQFFGSCSDTPSIPECLGTKMVLVLNRAARANKIDLVPGVSFVR